MSQGIVIGCDVSKAWVDVCDARAPASRSTRIANAQGQIEGWVGTLPAGCRVGVEATGTMHELLAQCLVRAGHTVYVLNPRWVHAYARALGVRGKTDRSDARLIARYVAAEGDHLHPYCPPRPEQAELRRLLLRRIELAKLRAATRMSLGEQAAGIVEQFNLLMRQVERRIKQLIAADEQWRGQAAQLQRLPGVGPLVAAHLVQVLGRIPFRSVDAFIAHTGTDPRPNDSGQKQGKRRLSHHGDAALRHMLFMAALAACKRPEWRTLYEHHRAKGLASTAALVVIARKLARLAYGMFKHGYTYDPARILTTGATCHAS